MVAVDRMRLRRFCLEVAAAHPSMQSALGVTARGFLEEFPEPRE